MYFFVVHFLDGEVLREKSNHPLDLMERLLRSYQGQYAQIIITVIGG